MLSICLLLTNYEPQPPIRYAAVVSIISVRCLLDQLQDWQSMRVSLDRRTDALVGHEKAQRTYRLVVDVHRQQEQRTSAGRIFPGI